LAFACSKGEGLSIADTIALNRILQSSYVFGKDFPVLNKVQFSLYYGKLVLRFFLSTRFNRSLCDKISWQLAHNALPFAVFVLPPDDQGFSW